MKTRLLYPFISLFFASNIYSQESEKINTDRPDQSDGTYILPAKSLQLETGVLYGNDGSSYLMHNNMLRYGLGRKTEVRLLIDYGKYGSNTSLYPLGLSFKHNLVEQKEMIPAITLVGYAYLPFLSSKNVKPDHLPFTLLLAFQNDLNDKLSLGYNFGLVDNGSVSTKNWLSTVSFAYECSGRISLFSEYFAQYNKHNAPDHNVDAGVLYFINNRLQLDIAAGTSLFQQGKSQFITTGISYRFK